MNRRRLLQSILLLAGLVGIALVVAKTFDEADEQVLPSARGARRRRRVLRSSPSCRSARAWVSLFSDLVESRASHLIMRGTFYLAQLTKYLPAGGIVQTASQVGLAPSAGVPIRRAAVAFPVSVVGAFVACGTLGSGLVFDSELAAWIARARPARPRDRRVPPSRAHGLGHRPRAPVRQAHPGFGPAADPAGHHRLLPLGARHRRVAVRRLHRSSCTSLDSDLNPYFVFCAFALSWLVGFLAVPIPAGVGVREAVLVVLLPGVGAAPLLAASLAARLLSIGAELLAVAVNRVVARRHAAAPRPRSRWRPSSPHPTWGCSGGALRRQGRFLRW